MMYHKRPPQMSQVFLNLANDADLFQAKLFDTILNYFNFYSNYFE